MRYIVRMVVCALTFSALSNVLGAQETRGSIEGIVRDTSGAVLPGVTVEARSPSLVGASTAISDAQGIYRFPALAPGVYDVSATLAGFSPRKVSGVQLLLGQILKVDIALAVAGVAESVQVMATSPVIDVRQNAASAVITAEVIDRIPKGRDFASVLVQAPGASNETKAGGYQLDGSSGSENHFLVDGLDMTSLRTGTQNNFGNNTANNTPTNPIRTDFVAEVQVKSSGYNAEYRAATGGVVSVLTKTGSNDWHGSAGTYFDTLRLRGALRQTLRLNPSDQTIAENVKTKSADYTDWEPVFELGGPVIRDRIWFYAGGVTEVMPSERTVRFAQNGTTGTFKSTDKQYVANYNVTGQITNKLRTRVSALDRRDKNGPALPAIEPDGLTSNSTPANFPSPIHTDNFSDQITISTDWVASPKVYVNVTGGMLKYGARGFGAGTELRHSFTGSNTSTTIFPDIPASLRQLNGYVDKLSSSTTVRDDYTRFNLNADATYYAAFKGQHQIKTGFQFERLANDVLTGQTQPTITLNWNASRSTFDGRQVRGTYGFWSTTKNVVTVGDIHANNVGVFAQDAWTISQRLTLNLGIRAESEDVPSYRAENPGIHFGWSDKITPRVGFAWDIAGDSRWKGYGSWGIFNDITKLEMPQGSFGGQHWITYYYTLDTFDWPSITCQEGRPPEGGTCPGTFIEQIDSRHPSNDANNNLIDPNLKPVKTQEFSLGLEHELSSRMSVGIRYSHKWLDRTIEDVGVQVAGIGEIFRIANPGFGLAEHTLTAICPTCPDQPPAKRTYDGLEFRLVKRYSNRWQMTASYLYSRLYGNYSGLASSDENGRTSPNVNRYFDGLYQSFDQRGQPVFGLLQTDRPHEVKITPSYDFKWGTQVGMFYLIEVGTPQQTQISEKSIPFYPLGRNNLGRTPMFSQTDLFLQHNFALPGSKRLNLGVNVTNLFDQDTVTRLFTTPYRDSLNISDAAFFAGFDAVAVAKATTAIRPDPRFGLPDQWQNRRTARLQVKFVF